MSVNSGLVLVKSPFLQVVQDGDLAVIWHSLFGHPQVVTRETLDFINAFARPQSIADALGDAEMTDQSMEILFELMELKYLNPTDFNDRDFLAANMAQRSSALVGGSSIQYLELIMSESCNLRCTYCIHFENLETSDRIQNPDKLMTFDRARETVDAFLQILRTNGLKVAEVNFGGGEPLMAWAVIEKVLSYCQSKYGSEFEFRFSMNTNGSLITPAIARVLKAYKVEIASSLDGVQKANDKVRVTVTGKGSFDRIVRGFDALAAEDYPLDGFAVTVTEANFTDLDHRIIDWAAARNMTQVRIDIDVIGMVSVPIEVIVEKLMSIRRYAATKNIDIPGFWSRPAENLNDSTLDKHVAFCGAVRGNSMCVSPSGNIYGCGYSTTKLGDLNHIHQFADDGGDYARFVRDHLTGVMVMCRGCKIEGQCGGGCNITQEFARASKTAKIERMCDFYRAMTDQLLLDQLHAVSTSD